MTRADLFHVLNSNQTHRPAVENFFRDIPRGQFAWVERTSHPTHLETLVEWAVREGRRTIVVWGGDGTLSRVVQSLHDLNALETVSLALIPVGTCNDFARKFGFFNWRRQAQAVMEPTSTTSSVDIGVLNLGKRKRLFINNSGFGRTYQAARSGRRNAVGDILHFTRKNLTVTWDNSGQSRKETFQAFFGVIFNSPYFGGGKYFSEQVSPTDGQLNGFFVPAQNKISLLLKFIRSAWSKQLADPLVRRVDGRLIDVESDMDLYPQVDGEMVQPEPVKKLRYSILDKALKFIVPRS